MDPPPDSLMVGITCFVPRNTPLELTSWIVSHSDEEEPPGDRAECPGAGRTGAPGGDAGDQRGAAVNDQLSVRTTGQ